MGANDQLGEAAGDAGGFTAHAEAALIQDQQLMNRLVHAPRMLHHPAGKIDPNRTSLYACGSIAAGQAASIRPDGSTPHGIPGIDQ